MTNNIEYITKIEGLCEGQAGINGRFIAASAIVENSPAHELIKKSASGAIELEKEVTRAKAAEQALADEVKIRQIKLKPGTGITLVEDSSGKEVTINSTGSYTAGDNIIIDQYNEISVDMTDIYDKSEVNTLIAAFSEVIVVRRKPDIPKLNCIYYVGTISPYQVWFYGKNDTGTVDWYYMGTTEVNLVDYRKKADQDIIDDDMKAGISSKQDKLTAGTNIIIDSTTNKISATDTTYTAGNHISIDVDNKISTDATIVSIDSEAKILTIDGVQHKLASGAVIDGNEVSNILTSDVNPYSSTNKLATMDDIAAATSGVSSITTQGDLQVSATTGNVIISHANLIEPLDHAKLAKITFDSEGHITSYATVLIEDSLTSSDPTDVLSAKQGKVLNDSKQDKLPTVINNRYLHTNSTTGDLEWVEVSGGSRITLSGVTSEGKQIISTDVSDIELDITNLRLDLDSESATRFGADLLLQNDLTAEASNRSAGDTTLTNNLSAESSTRAAADSTEEAARKAIENKIKNYSGLKDQSLISESEIDWKIASSLGYFQGIKRTEAEIQSIVNPSPNDYAILAPLNSEGKVTSYSKYKYNCAKDSEGSFILPGTWLMEYEISAFLQLNQNQIDALNSGVTANVVGQGFVKSNSGLTPASSLTNTVFRSVRADEQRVIENGPVITISADAPTGGTHGDIWLQYI